MSEELNNEEFNIDAVKDFFQPENLKVFFQPDNLKAFATRAWHGELPLWQAFWGLTVLPNLILNLLVKLISVIIPFQSFHVLLGIIMLILTTPLTVLQLVSVWRSAVNYNTANPSVYWGYAAQALAAIGGFMFVMGLIGAVFRH